MSRISYRFIASLAIVTVGALGGNASAQGGPPPVAGLAAQITALQANVANLTQQVTTLQNVVTTLQGTAGAVQVWHNSNIALPVQRNDATFVSDWTLSTLASLSLPAGSYYLVAKTSLQDPLISASTFFCHITRAADVIDESAAYSVGDEPETMALQGVVILSSPDTVALKCGATGPASTPGSAESFVSQLVAVRANLQ
jgi:hypothetical protein